MLNKPLSLEEYFKELHNRIDQCIITLATTFTIESSFIMESWCNDSYIISIRIESKRLLELDKMKVKHILHEILHEQSVNAEMPIKKSSYLHFWGFTPKNFINKKSILHYINTQKTKQLLADKPVINNPKIVFKEVRYRVENL